MKKNNLINIISMSCGLITIISVFLPYAIHYGETISLWKLENPSRFMYILLGLLVVVLYLINKKTEITYLMAGYGLFTEIGTIVSNGGFSGLTVGFYLILISSILVAILTFIYNDDTENELENS